VQKLLKKSYINSNELYKLLEARDKGTLDFLLIDVRERMEFRMGHIKGVDLLKPTSSFGQWGQTLFDEMEDKDTVVIFTCHTGSRSGEIQNVFKKNGHRKVINHYGGIASYRGQVIR